MSHDDPLAHDVGDRVREAVVMRLASGDRCPGIHVVAERLGTSVRTLQRRLHAIGVTYGDVVQQARCDAAQRLLKQHRKVCEVARQLGYSDPAHFTRAFQRWTGTTPRDFRRDA